MVTIRDSVEFRHEFQIHRDNRRSPYQRFRPVQSCPKLMVATLRHVALSSASAMTARGPYAKKDVACISTQHMPVDRVGAGSIQYSHSTLTPPADTQSVDQPKLSHPNMIADCRCPADKSCSAIYPTFHNIRCYLLAPVLAI